MLPEAQLHDAQALATINSVLDLEHQRRVAPELTTEVLHSLTTHPPQKSTKPAKRPPTS